MKGAVGTIFALACSVLVAVSHGQAPAGGYSYGPGPSGGLTQGDIDILTFVYNLEVFEANFYQCAAYGGSVSAQYLGGGPGPVGCNGPAKLNATTMYFAQEFAREESAHVALLYTALKQAGVNPVAPLTNISSGVFNSIASGAFNTSKLSPAFDPYANDLFFLMSGFLFEDAGASGYLGALPSITSPTYRETAAQIGSTEAYHAAALRTNLFLQLNTVAAYGLTVANATSDIVLFENMVAGSPQIKYNIFTSNYSAATSNVNANALVPTATTEQVLHLVTGGAPAGSGGGFFPSNLNGNVKN